MIYVNRTKYDRTKSVTFPKYRHLRLGRTQVTARQLEADAVASELAAGKGGVGLQSVAGEDAAASPDINVAHPTVVSNAPLPDFPRGKMISICAMARRLRSLTMSATSTETGSEAWMPF